MTASAQHESWSAQDEEADGPGVTRRTLVAAGSRRVVLDEPTLREFTDFAQARRGVLLAAAYDLTGDMVAAEDLVQSALLATYRAWPRIENKSVATSYVRRTMANLQISAWRRRRLRECPTDQVPEVADLDNAIDSADLRATMRAALARLTQPQRTVLVLRYYEGLTDTEVAQRLGLSVGTVKSTIWRALRRLRDDPSVRCERLAWGPGQPATTRTSSDRAAHSLAS